MRHLSLAFLALPLAAACESGSTETRSDTRSDAGDAAIPDGGADQADGEGEAPDATDFVVPRCPGATWVTAPSGAACAPDRIEHAKGLAGICYGPPVGDTCDRLDVFVASGEQGALPDGFLCGAVENGSVTCSWRFAGDASFGVLDEATLEAACAATIAAPSARVRCVDFGS